MIFCCTIALVYCRVLTFCDPWGSWVGCIWHSWSVNFASVMCDIFSYMSSIFHNFYFCELKDFISVLQLPVIQHYTWILQSHRERKDAIGLYRIKQTEGHSQKLRNRRYFWSLDGPQSEVVPKYLSTFWDYAFFYLVMNVSRCDVCYGVCLELEVFFPFLYWNLFLEVITVYCYTFHWLLHGENYLVWIYMYSCQLGSRIGSGSEFQRPIPVKSKTENVDLEPVKHSTWKMHFFLYAGLFREDFIRQNKCRKLDRMYFVQLQKWDHKCMIMLLCASLLFAGNFMCSESHHVMWFHIHFVN